MSHFPDPNRSWFTGLTTIDAALGDIDAKAQKTINGKTGDVGVGSAVSSAPTSPIQLVGEHALGLQAPVAWDSTQTYERIVGPMLYQAFGSTATYKLSSTGSLQSRFAFHPLWIPAQSVLIDRALITQVSAYFVVDPAIGSLPATFPKMWAARRHRTLGYHQYLGFAPTFFPTPGSTAAYKNGGIANAITASASNVDGTALVDLANFSYEFGFEDDSVGNNTFFGFRVTYDVTDMEQA